jgi:hypothetical protein
MICSRDNVTMTGTFSQYVSTYCTFMDMYSGRVHDADTNEREHMGAKLCAASRGEKLNMRKDEPAFYDALEVNDSAVKVLGEPTLIKIARELVATVRKNVTIDWTSDAAARVLFRFRCFDGSADSQTGHGRRH